MTYESHWYFLQTQQRDLQIVSIIQSWTSFGYEFVSIIQEFKPSVLLVECFAETNPRLQEDIFSIHLNLLMCFEEMYFQYLVFFLTSSWLTQWYDSGHKVIRLSGDRSTSSPQRLGYRDGMRWFSEIDILQNSWYALIELDYVETLFSFDPCEYGGSLVFLLLYLWSYL